MTYLGVQRRRRENCNRVTRSSTEHPRWPARARRVAFSSSTAAEEGSEDEEEDGEEDEEEGGEEDEEAGSSTQQDASRNRAGSLAAGFDTGTSSAVEALMAESEEDDDEGAAEIIDEEAVKATLKKEATKCLRAWCRMAPDWHSELKLDESATIDVMELIELDVGPLYFRIEQEDEGSRRFGYIPEMARCRIGSLNSEGFCERMLRAAGHVLTEGNSLLKSSELEKLTLLRMNKDFMQFMRANYSHVSRQQFNRTVAERE